MFGAEKSSISSLRRIPVLKTSLKCKNNFAIILNFEPWWHDERSKVEVYCIRHWDRIPVRCDDAHMGCAMVLHNPSLKKIVHLFLKTILKLAFTAFLPRVCKRLPHNVLHRWLLNHLGFAQICQKAYFCLKFQKPPILGPLLAGEVAH